MTDHVGFQRIFLRNTSIVKILEISLSLTIVLSTVQNPLATLFPEHSAIINSFDDIFLVFSLFLAFLISVYESASRWLLFVLCILAGCIAIYAGCVQNDISMSQGVFLFRQILIPFELIIIGCAISSYPRSLFHVLTVSLICGLANAFYAWLEFIGLHLLDPSVIAKTQGLYIYPNGFPGYYIGFGMGGNLLLRVGGLVLNPPTLGILLGTLIVLVIFYFPFKSMTKLILLIYLGIPFVASISRAGYLLVCLTLVLPFLVRFIPKSISIIIIVVLSLPFATVINSQGGSGSHLTGLLTGISDAFKFPLGQGFGLFGNFSSNHASASESLWGIGLSAFGVAFFIMLLVFCFIIFSHMKGQNLWLNSLALSAFGCAAFAETASSLTGSIPIWLLTGVSLVVQKSDGIVFNRLTVKRSKFKDFLYEK